MKWPGIGYCVHKVGVGKRALKGLGVRDRGEDEEGAPLAGAEGGHAAFPGPGALRSRSARRPASRFSAIRVMSARSFSLAARAA